MIGTALHWVDGPWKGKLAMAARPRGGEWLQDEMAYWQRCGVSTILSLLEPDEERDLGLLSERAVASAAGIAFRSLPLEDRGVPASENLIRTEIEFLDSDLRAGRNTVLHCRQGIGRTGLVAASLLLATGWDFEITLQRLSAVRGIPVPETQQQRKWIDQFAKNLAATAR